MSPGNRGAVYGDKASSFNMKPGIEDLNYPGEIIQSTYNQIESKLKPLDRRNPNLTTDIIGTIFNSRNFHKVWDTNITVSDVSPPTLASFNIANKTFKNNLIYYNNNLEEYNNGDTISSGSNLYIIGANGKFYKVILNDKANSIWSATGVISNLRRTINIILKDDNNKLINDIKDIKITNAILSYDNDNATPTLAGGGEITKTRKNKRVPV